MNRWKHGEDPFEESIAAKLVIGENHHLHGCITLNNNRNSHASTTTIFDDRHFDIAHGSHLHGVSERGLVSLISCSIEGWRRSSMAMSCTVRSYYAVFGNVHIYRDKPEIRKVQFGFNDLDTVFGRLGGDAFDTISDPDQHIIDSIERYKPDHALSISGYKRPTILYFTGKTDLLPATETVLGRVSAQRAVHWNWSVSGTSVNDYPSITIDFADEPVTLEAAIDKMSDVRSFFAWILGYSPKYTNVKMFMKHPKPDTPDTELDVFMSDRGGTTGRENKFPGSMLISPSRQPDIFVEVMGKWLDRNKDRERPNTSFFSLMRGMHTIVYQDRMCVAANIFDQLPGGGNMLNVAQNRYRRVIRRHLRLQRMKQVIEAAVNCRHHITHGRTKDDAETHGADYSDYGTVDFLTRALRLVYGASELIECGWDMKHWLTLPNGRDHPFGIFIADYEEAMPKAIPG